MKNLIEKLITKTRKHRAPNRGRNAETRDLSVDSDVTVYHVNLDPNMNIHFQR